MTQEKAIKHLVYRFSRNHDYASDPVPEGQRVIDCGLGSSPFGYPEQVDEVMKQIDAKMLNEYPKDPYSRELAGLVKERFNLKRSSIYFGGTGSYGLLASLLSDLADVQRNTNLEVVGAGPQFTNIEILAKRAHIPYRPITPDLELPYEEKVELLIQERQKAKCSAIVYIDNPNNPTGAAVNLETIYKLCRATAKNDLLIVDEAYGDSLPDNQSAFHLVEGFNHMVTLRSISKTIGLASPRLGYMAMSGTTAEAYENLELVFSLDAITQMIGKAALNPDILSQFLPKVRKMTMEAKNKFGKMLEDAGVEKYDTHANVSILLAKGSKNFLKS